MDMCGGAWRGASPGFSLALLVALVRLSAAQIPGPGCADGTREGFFESARYPKIAACAGDVRGVDVTSSFASSQFCATGWHVCTGADINAGRNDPNHFTAVTQAMATNFSGRYVYNANNDCNSCQDTCGGRNDGGHSGHGCHVVNGTDPDLACMGGGCNVRDHAACLANIRLDSGNGGCTVRSNLISGVICCRNDYQIQTSCSVPPVIVNVTNGPLAPPTGGLLLVNISIPLNYEVGMDLTLAAHAQPVSAWTTIAHFTATGNDGGYGEATLGDRIPYIGFRPNTFSLYIVDGGDSSPGNSNFDNVCPLGTLGTLAPGTTTRLFIELRMTQMRVFINGVIACTETRGTRRTWPNAMVYLGDPWYNPANVNVSHFYVAEGLFQTEMLVGDTPQQLQENHIIAASIVLPVNYEIGFTIRPLGTIHNWGSILVYTASGSSRSTVYGDRIPGVWFYPNSTRLHVIDGQASMTNDECPVTEPLPIGSATNIRIRMSSNRVWVYFNGTLRCTELREDRAIFSNVTVYMANRLQAPANAQVSSVYLSRGSVFGPNIVVNGGFEIGWQQPWQMVQAGSGGLPGWTVQSGNIDYGNYNTGGYCNQSSYNANLGCAAEGEAFLDLCGTHQGRITQTLITDVSAVYTFSFLYESHATCNAEGAQVQALVSITTPAGAVLLNDSVTHLNDRSWSLNWSAYSHTFTATDVSTQITFAAVSGGCGCLLLDDVKVQKNCLKSPPPPPPCKGNLLNNGGFESGWRQPYQTATAASRQLPGWTVAIGNVHFGNFRSYGHCTTSCAADGLSFLNLCGTSRGAIQQRIATVVGSTYIVSLAYSGHCQQSTPTQASATMQVEDTENGEILQTANLTHYTDHTWDLNWSNYTTTFHARSSSVMLSLISTTSASDGCCLLLDSISVSQTCAAQPPPPPCLASNMLYNGNFESGWIQPWRLVQAGSGGLPGWVVTSGNIDYGNYNTSGHCDDFVCAADGSSFLDLCGSTQGGIAQNITTVPGMLYTLSLKYEAHSGCSAGHNEVTEILINGASYHILQHVNEQNWTLQWATFVGEFQAFSTITEVSFQSRTSGCGCMLLDSVSVRPECVPTNTGGIEGSRASICNGAVSNSRIVPNGCFRNMPPTYNVSTSTHHACLTDGLMQTQCMASGPDALYSAQLNCRGRVTGSVIFVGGPDRPNVCGGFQEGGTVLFSADGNNWQPAASWSCNSGWCDVDGVGHAIDNSFGSGELRVIFDPEQVVEYVAITFGNADTHVNEIFLEPGTRIQCIDETAATHCPEEVESNGNTCAAENGVCSCDGYVVYGHGSTWSSPLRVSGTIACSNSVFGDPLVGVVKECRCSSGEAPVWNVCQQISSHYMCENQGCSSAFPLLDTWQSCQRAAQQLGLGNVNGSNETIPCVAQPCPAGVNSNYSMVPCRYCTTLADMEVKPAGCYYKPENLPGYRLWFNPTHSNYSVIDPNRLSVCGVSLAAATCSGTTCHMAECGRGYQAHGFCTAENQTFCDSDDSINEIRCCADIQPNPLWTKQPGCNVWAESELVHGGCSNGTFCQAANLCARNGGRLCTAAEVQAGCTRFSGCNHDNDIVWTASSVHATCNHSVLQSMMQQIQSADTDYGVTPPQVGNCRSAGLMALYSNQDPTWAYRSNCHCYSLLNLDSADQLDCLPFSTAQYTWKSMYLQCLTYLARTSNVIPNSSHYTICGSGDPSICRTQGIATISQDYELHEVRCCTDNATINWVRRAGCSVWSESDAWSEGCQSLNYPQAVAFCASVDGRLCTAAEVSSGCAAGTGCGHDADFVWTSTQSLMPASTEGPTTVCDTGFINNLLDTYVRGRTSTDTCSTFISGLQVGRIGWQNISNCNCLLFIPQQNISHLDCYPFLGASETVVSAWETCSAIQGHGVLPTDPSICHQVACGSGIEEVCRRRYENNVGNLSCASESELHEVRCCSSVLVANWTRRSGCSVWSESDAWQEGCQALNFVTAQAFCHHVGGRLCTATEINSRCASGTGCGHDEDYIWTSSRPTLQANAFGPVCASEHENCQCNGSVIYGVGQTWSLPLAVHGSVHCSNSVFGDPIYSVHKFCRCQSAVPPVCSTTVLDRVLSHFVTRNQSCIDAINAAESGNIVWDYSRYCDCYLLIPEINASQLTCAPYPGAVTTVYQDWLQCHDMVANTLPTNTSSHAVRCGRGVTRYCAASYGSAGQAIASDAELHEVRCCSENQIAGWTKQRNCYVWSESDAWKQGCQTLNFPDAAALCRAQGARLCTVSEVAAGCTRGTGCGHDADLIWTRTTLCEPGAIDNVISAHIQGRGNEVNIHNCAAMMRSYFSGEPNQNWTYANNCPCYLLLPNLIAANLSCLPFNNSEYTFYDSWVQCAALATATNGSMVDPGQCHTVICGNGASSCNGLSTNCASDAELHEVRCCSDSAIAGWTQREHCTVWSESDAWTQGCQVLNYSTAVAFCAVHGGRLCTLEEVQAQCAAGTGCGHDFDLIWTSGTMLDLTSDSPTMAPTSSLCIGSNACDSASTICVDSTQNASGYTCQCRSGYARITSTLCRLTSTPTLHRPETNPPTVAHPTAAPNIERLTSTPTLHRPETNPPTVAHPTAAPNIEASASSGHTGGKNIAIVTIVLLCTAMAVYYKYRQHSSKVARRANLRVKYEGIRNQGFTGDVFDDDDDDEQLIVSDIVNSITGQIKLAPRDTQYDQSRLIGDESLYDTTAASSTSGYMDISSRKEPEHTAGKYNGERDYDTGEERTGEADYSTAREERKDEADYSTAGEERVGEAEYDTAMGGLL